MKTFHHAFVSITGEINTIEENGSRRYTTPHGVFPSVTTVTGWAKRAFFAKWRRDNPEESKRILSRGTKVHSIIEDYLQNRFETTLQEAKGTEELDIFNTMQPHIDCIDNIRAIEVALWSKKVGLAGRTDCIAEYNGVLSVVDFKTSKNPKSEDAISDYFTQGAAYALMWQDLTGQRVDNITIIIGVSSTGECQVFEAKTMDWVEPLADAIALWKSEQVSVV
jgi:ATP-dependent exoDNAse (exonuclease V) beta subunit